MKAKFIVSILLFITTIVVARQIPPFLGWDRLQESSSDIVIVHCGKQPPPKSGKTEFVLTLNSLKSNMRVEALAVLKGSTNVVTAQLSTDHELQVDQNYLIFSHYDAGIYEAYEEYRVIPLGESFSTNLIAGKSLDEQLQVLFKLRTNHLNQEIRRDEEEKARLEELPVK